MIVVVVSFVADCLKEKIKRVDVNKFNKINFKTLYYILLYVIYFLSVKFIR